MKGIGIAITIMACAMPAFAQEADFAAMMEQVNRDVPPPDRKAIETDALQTMQAIAEKQSSCSPKAVQLATPSPITADRAVTQGILSKKLKNGWVVSGRAIGCPSPRSLRFVVFQLPDDKVIARLVNEGDSLTTPTLMRDTSIGAAVAAGQEIRKKKTCEESGMKMIGTRVISKSRDLSPDFYGARYAGSWEEVWTFETCGIRAEVPVVFRADGMGGTYTTLKSEEIRLVD